MVPQHNDTTTLSIMTLRIMDFSATSSIRTVGTIKLSKECRYFKVSDSFVMLSVIMVNVVILSVIILGVVILSVLVPLRLPGYTMCNYLTIDRS